MRVLLIDNHDSFTYNLAHLVFQAAGVMPTVVLVEDVTEEDIRAADRIIISPGPGRPEEYPTWYPRIFTDPALKPVAAPAATPILGVCLGFQGMCMAFGATLSIAKHPRHGEVTEGHTRYHSLAVTDLPPELEPTEFAADGTLMAARHRSLPFQGVQYHPESIASVGGVELMREFLGVQQGVRTVWCEQVDTKAQASELFQANFAAEEHAVWLDSSDGSGWSYLCTGSRTCGLDEVEAMDMPVDTSAAPCDFALGWAGYVTYEGEARLLEVDRCLAVSPTGEVFALGFEPWQPRTSASIPAEPLPATPREFRFDHATYLDKIRRCQEFIARGDSYELCLTNSLSFAFPADPLAGYNALRREHPAPFASFVRFGSTSALSTSPERFLRLVDASLEAKPIKGTRPRGSSRVQDAQLKEELATSVKERAENLMICDLLRNDLGRVAVPGSVTVPVLCGIESFATVHQMVSTIRAVKRPDATPVDCFRAAFPGGSMTGAPKERSVEILRELEEHHHRGIYSGAIGYISLSGAMDWSIVIRTIVIEGETATYGMGGAITRLSDPEEEWQEILVKAAPVL